MKRSIVIEGLDATGKSTLVKKLSKQYNLPIYVAGPPPSSEEIALQMSNEQLCRAMHGHIFDRVTCISRPCYQIDSKSDHLNILHRHRNKLLQFSVIIYCNPHKFGEHVIKDYDTDEHIEHITKNHEEIARRYDELMASIQHMSYDFKQHDINALISLINRVRNEECEIF